MAWFKKKKTVSVQWRLYSVLAFAAALIVDGLAGSTKLIGGVDTKTVSDSFPNLLAPAPVTFAIWGVIYVLLVLFCVYLFGMWRSKHSGVDVDTLNHVLPWFTASSLLNIAWMFAWQYKVIWLSVLLILPYLFAVGTIGRLLSQNMNVSWKEFVAVRLPFGVYFGWLTVATIANITTWLVSIGWDGFGVRPGIWLVAVLLVSAGIGIATAWRQKDWAYLAVFVWAYAGILFKHLSPGGFNGEYPTTIVTLSILLSVSITTTLYLLKNWPFGKRLSD